MLAVVFNSHGLEVGTWAIRELEEPFAFSVYNCHMRWRCAVFFLGRPWAESLLWMVVEYVVEYWLRGFVFLTLSLCEEGEA